MTGAEWIELTFAANHPAFFPLTASGLDLTPSRATLGWLLDRQILAVGGALLRAETGCSAQLPAALRCQSRMRSDERRDGEGQAEPGHNTMAGRSALGDYS